MNKVTGASTLKKTSAKRALITGASSGIGAALALRLAREGYSLILTARRLDRLKTLRDQCLKLSSSLEAAQKVEIHNVDVSDKSSVEAFFLKGFEPEGFLQGLTVLVNNAGLAKGVDKMDRSNLEDWEQMLDTNVLGLLLVTRKALPELLKNRGHVVNIGSVAGRWSYPGGAVYSATKAAVRAITEGLRLDVQGSGLRVTNIAPGMVESEFSDVRLGDKEKAKKLYENMSPLTPDDIAECVSWSLSRPAHVNVQEMIVFPTNQAGVGYVHRD